MKKLVKRSENAFNTVDAFKKKNCKCKACSCKCRKWISTIANRSGDKSTSSYFTLAGIKK